MDYLRFFRLEHIPFLNTPDNRFFFESRSHKEALIRLIHSAEQMSGLALVVGDIGAGKTTLARKFLDSLDDTCFESALLVILHTRITADWLLHKIALQVGVPSPPKTKQEILPALFDRLFELFEANRKTVVLVDEAQMLQTREIMEEFRGLLNLEVPSRKLIHFVFFALSEVEDYLRIDPPLYQRMSMRFALQSLSYEETVEYVLHRLKIAGADNPIFSEAAFELIFHYSKGVPRVINTICENCLFEAFLLKNEFISRALTMEVVKNLGYNG